MSRDKKSYYQNPIRRDKIGIISRPRINRMQFLNPNLNHPKELKQEDSYKIGFTSERSNISN